jgi:formylglycine-generating enzyme required for sulfatase activity
VLTKPYAEPDGEWRRLGVSPIEGAFLPFGLHRVRVTKTGFTPLEAAVLMPEPPSLALVPEKDARPGMVFIPAGRSRFAGAPLAELPAFWLDRYELANREWKAFVDAGGYRRPELWKHVRARRQADPVRPGDGHLPRSHRPARPLDLGDGRLPGGAA